MDYFTMSQEYFSDAEKIMKTLRKYESRLNGCKNENLEKLNSIIASYRYIYYDLYNTAKLLRHRAEKMVKTTDTDFKKENKDAA